MLHFVCGCTMTPPPTPLTSDELGRTSLSYIQVNMVHAWVQKHSPLFYFSLCKMFLHITRDLKDPFSQSTINPKWPCVASLWQQRAVPQMTMSQVLLPTRWHMGRVLQSQKTETYLLLDNKPLHTIKLSPPKLVFGGLKHLFPEDR